MEKGSKKDWTILMMMATSRKEITRDTLRTAERNSFILVQVPRLPPRMKKDKFDQLVSNPLSEESLISPKQVLSKKRKTKACPRLMTSELSTKLNSLLEKEMEKKESMLEPAKQEKRDRLLELRKIARMRALKLSETRIERYSKRETMTS